ncbi:hypothetical protein ACFQZ4_16535 [Catellatospora coxensis]
MTKCQVPPRRYTKAIDRYAASSPTSCNTGPQASAKRSSRPTSPRSRSKAAR